MPRISRLTSSSILLLLVLASVAFATTTQTATDSGRTLYAINTPPTNSRFNTQTDLSFTQSTTLSTTGRVMSGTPSNLASGAQVCVNSIITVQTSDSGLWAAPNYYAYIPYPTGYTTSCPLAPSWTTVSSNRPVSWSTNNYNSLIGEYLCWSDEGCWGKEGSLTTQRINAYEGPGGVTFTNRKGDSNYVCTGTDSLAIVRSGSTVYSNSQTTNPSTTFSRSFTPTSTGTLTFKTNFAVNGCAAVVRFPSCPSYDTEYVLGRTSAQSGTGAPTYSINVPESSTSIEIVNRQAAASLVSITCPGMTCPPPPGPIAMNSGQMLYMIVRIRNSGDVSINVTSVSANNGFTAQPLNAALCTALGITCPPSNGFNSPVAAGATKDLHVVITAPVVTSPVSTAITFTAIANAPTCSATQPQQITGSVNYNVIPGGITCSVAPSVAVIPQGSPRSFTIACLENGTLPVPCSNVSWSLNGAIAGTISGQGDTGATVTPSSGVGTTGRLNATNGTYMCSSFLIVTRPISIHSCRLSPSSATMTSGTSGSFTLECFENTTIPVPCRSTAWNVSGVSATLSGISDSGVTLTMSSSSGTGSLQASNGSYTCSSSLTASSGPDGCVGPNCDPDDPTSVGCLVSPANAFAKPGEKKAFRLLCEDSSTHTYTASCGGDVQWQEPTGMGTVIISYTVYSNELMNVTVASSSSAVGKSALIRAGNPSGTIYCSALMNVSNVQCKDYT